MDKDLYTNSFSRNIGILTEEEQARLWRSTVAIAGLGGIGSNTLIQLARIGVGRFRIADFDRYELSNINRQHGATLNTLGQLKAEVLENEVKAINSSADVVVFREGVTELNAAIFLSEAEIVVDAIDFYSIEAHLLLHRAARERKLYTVMGSPIGFSACLQIYDPKGMSLEEYAGILPDMQPIEKQLRYACGLVPELAHIDYFDVSSGKSRTNFVDRTGPSIGSALALASALVATEIALLLLKRRPPRAIPYTHQFDPCTFRYHTTYVAGGMSNYDPKPAIARIPDKGSLIPQVFETFYLKSKMKSVSVGSGAMCYKMQGEGEPVLFLNPLGMESRFWARQFYELGPGFQTIAFDGRGCGARTEAPEGFSTLDMTGDALAVLDHLGIERAHVVGLALGGCVAQELALRWPARVKTLTLISTYGRVDAHIQDLTARWRRDATEKGMEVLFDECLPWVLGSTYVYKNPGEIGNLRTFLRLGTPNATQFRRLSMAGVQHDTLKRLGKINIATMVIHGEEDRVVEPEHARRLAATIPGAQLWMSPGQPHFLTWTCAAEFNTRLSSFLAGNG